MHRKKITSKSQKKNSGIDVNRRMLLGEIHINGNKW